MKGEVDCWHGKIDIKYAFKWYDRETFSIHLILEHLGRTKPTGTHLHEWVGCVCLIHGRETGGANHVTRMVKQGATPQ